MQKKTDNELMKLLAGKNKMALKELYRRYEMQVFNFLSRYTGHREIAQELIQDTFTRLWFASHTFDQKKGNFKAWLYTIALNLARNEMSKKEYTYQFLEPTEIHNYQKVEDDVHTGNRGPNAVLEQKEIQTSVANALGKLQPHLREVIIMKNYQHLKFREIARVTKTPESTLKARYHKAISELKKYLQTREVTNHA
ncbi:MAG: RNA polymerase sigma factor [Candidatus Aminicenantes bacterium]|nr:MAG: RNA polymerase sigma factor [Candidatus Aminicenantes bacterium]